MILDTHHHLWKVDRGDYYWMTGDFQALRRDYLPDDLRPLLRKAGVTKTIVVQAAPTLAETDFLLALAEETDFIAGVCGWLDMESDSFSRDLERYRAHPYFAAIRPMIQDLPDDRWILRPQVLANLKHLAAEKFPFEFLLYPRQMSAVIEAIEEVPGLHCVIDHISKPVIREGMIEPWKSNIARMATRPNVFCKLSGMITEARHDAWTPDDLRPYIEHVFDCFGVERLLFGSDWPVCLLAGDYAEVINALRTVLGPRLDRDATDKLFYGNGARFYGINWEGP